MRWAREHPRRVPSALRKRGPGREGARASAHPGPRPVDRGRWTAVGQEVWVAVPNLPLAHGVTLEETPELSGSCDPILELSNDFL